MKSITFALGLLTALTLSVTHAAESPATGTLIDFQTQAELPAPNDLGKASAYVEATGANPGELARRINKTLAEALALTKNAPEVKTKSGSVHTYPVYGKAGRTIESWRMRAELLLESRDSAALSELLGKLQASLAVGNLNFVPSHETRRKVEDEAALEAIARFQEKAARYAGALKKTYRVRSLSVQSGQNQPLYAMRTMAMPATADGGMPVEAGESNVVVTVTGQIELER